MLRRDDMHSKFFSYIITFPFEQLGWGLRKLSLSGSAGNVFAVTVYILICLAPCLLCWRLKTSGKLLKTDFFLPALSILLFAVIYYMINPGLLNSSVSGTGKILLGRTFYSVFFGYIILRILDKCSQADKKQLNSWLKALFGIIMFLFFCVILSECFENLSASFQSLKAANTLENAALITTYTFLVLQCITNIIPYALAIFILFIAIRALSALLTDHYSAAAVAAMEKLAVWCSRSLIITVLSSMVFNILQLLFHQSLHQINMVVSIPVFSIAFVLAVLLTTKYIRENQRLKQDNDLFI